MSLDLYRFRSWRIKHACSECGPDHHKVNHVGHGQHKMNVVCSVFRADTPISYIGSRADDISQCSKLE